MTTCAFPFRPAACFRVGGEDAGSYLQGQFSNELRHAAGSVVYGLFLNQKGKVVADAQVLKLAENSFLVVSGFTPADTMRQRLEEYIVADDVLLADETKTTGGLSLWGPDCGQRLKQLLGMLPQAGQFGQSGGILVYSGRRTRGENYEIIGADNLVRAVHAQLHAFGCIESEAKQVEFLRITQGIPAVPLDLGPGDLPNEGNLDEDAVSYTKGCYLGQEVMARLKNMGQVRRRLFVVQGAGKPPEVRTTLFQQERKTGEIRSVAGQEGKFVALAMLSLLNLDETTGLSLAPDAPPTMKIQSRG